MQDEYVRKCPFCGETEMIEVYNAAKAATSVSPVGNPFKATPLHHVVCANCGSVVRSFVKDVKKIGGK